MLTPLLKFLGVLMDASAIIYNIAEDGAQQISWADKVSQRA
jgi:hypothetical protein